MQRFFSIESDRRELPGLPGCSEIQVELVEYDQVASVEIGRVVLKERERHLARRTFTEADAAARFNVAQFTERVLSKDILRAVIEGDRLDADEVSPLADTAPRDAER